MSVWIVFHGDGWDGNELMIESIHKTKEGALAAWKKLAGSRVRKSADPFDPNNPSNYHVDEWGVEE